MFELKSDVQEMCAEIKDESFEKLLNNAAKNKENHGFTRNQAALRAQEHGVSKATFFRFINRQGSENPYIELDCLWAFVAVYNLPELESARLVRALLCEFMKRGLDGIQRQ